MNLSSIVTILFMLAVSTGAILYFRRKDKRKLSDFHEGPDVIGSQRKMTHVVSRKNSFRRLRKTPRAGTRYYEEAVDASKRPDVPNKVDIK